MPTTTTHDIPYYSLDGVTFHLDAVRPRKGGPFPAVAMLAGGGWKTADNATWADTADRLAGEGFAVMNADYPLAPPGGNFHSPVQEQAAAQLVRWVRANGGQYGAKPGKVGIIGGSSGGHLASWVGTGGTPGDDRPDAVVSWSGPSDLVLMTTELNGMLYPTVENFIGCPIIDCRPNYEAASPLYRVTSAATPHLIAYYEFDQIPNEQGKILHDALIAVGVSSQFLIAPGQGHGEQLADAASVWSASVNFLRSALSP